ncbi:MAG: hypothetical protein ACMG6S_28455, partial [Byssovorax sp.]
MFEAAGCGCTQVDCADGFGVELNKVSTVWEPGSYVVSINADGVKNSCTFAMPAVADPVCTSNLQMALNLIPISDPSNEIRGLQSVLIFGTPTLVQVTVARDGVDLGTNVFLPSYSENEPNGAICGPTCHVATSEL